MGEKIAYTYTITNQGKSPLAAPVTVRDNLLDVVCPPVNSTGNQDDLLDSGKSLKCTGSYVIADIDLRRGFVTNLAVAERGRHLFPQQSLTIYAGQTPPALSLTKSADKETYSQVEEQVLYTFMVTNPGSVPIPGPITVNDDLVMVRCPHLEKVGNQDNILDPGETLPCTGRYSITQEDIYPWSCDQQGLGPGIKRLFRSAECHDLQTQRYRTFYHCCQRRFNAQHERRASIL